MDEVIKPIFENIPIPKEGDRIYGNIAIKFRLDTCHTGYEGSSNGLADTFNLSGAFYGESLDMIYRPAFENLDGSIVFFPVKDKKLLEIKEFYGKGYCARMDFFELAGAPCAQVDVALPSEQFAKVKQGVTDCLDNSNVQVSFCIHAQRMGESSTLLVSSWAIHFARDLRREGEDWKHE